MDLNSGMIMKKIVSIKWISVLAGLLLAGSANANLIVNGSFEGNVVADGNWSWFPSAAVNGWEGSNVEIWHNLFGTSAVDAQQIAELNADGGNNGVWSIFQNFATIVDQSYDVSFAYRARQSNDESFNFSVGNLNTLVNDHVVSEWSIFTGSFIASSLWTELRFTSTDAGTLGNLIDDVNVNAHVPESNNIALFAIGLLGLGLVRRKSKV